MARIEQNDWLETFVAVADQGTFSQAAGVVHRSQSRVSAHVAALERALGTPLFDRRHRPVELTDAGEAFLPHAREVLASLDRGASAIDSLSGVRRGHVVVGAHPSISAGFLPGVLSQFTRHHPQVRIELSEATTIGLADGLSSGRLHLALRSTSASQPPEHLVSEPLWREPYVAVVPEGHPLTERPMPLSPAELEELPLVVIAQPGTGVDPDTDAVLRHWGLPAELAWSKTEQPQTLANLVKAGLGVGLINGLAMTISDTAGLTVLQVGKLDDGRQVGLWHDPERYMSSAARALYEQILATPRPTTTYPLTTAHPRAQQ